MKHSPHPTHDANHEIHHHYDFHQLVDISIQQLSAKKNLRPHHHHHHHHHHIHPLAFNACPARDWKSAAEHHSRWAAKSGPFSFYAAGTGKLRQGITDATSVTHVLFALAAFTPVATDRRPSLALRSSPLRGVCLSRCDRAPASSSSSLWSRCYARR